MALVQCSLTSTCFFFPYIISSYSINRGKKGAHCFPELFLKAVLDYWENYGHGWLYISFSIMHYCQIFLTLDRFKILSEMMLSKIALHLSATTPLCDIINHQHSLKNSTAVLSMLFFHQKKKQPQPPTLLSLTMRISLSDDELSPPIQCQRLLSLSDLLEHHVIPRLEIFT